MSHDELIVVDRHWAAQITAQAAQTSELVETIEALTGRPSVLEHLQSQF